MESIRQQVREEPPSPEGKAMTEEGDYKNIRLSDKIRQTETIPINKVAKKFRSSLFKGLSGVWGLKATTNRSPQNQRRTEISEAVTRRARRRRAAVR